jgi:protocatechuate 3,4-dioxygenase beta subunit
VTTVTDAAGVYRFRMAPGDAFVSLSGRVAGYTSLGGDESSRSVVIPSLGAAFALPPFVMAPGVKLVGRILDAAGMPLEGAKLIGVCNQTYCTPLNQPSATADAQGQFSLDTQADGQPIPLNQPVTFQVRLADGKEFDASVVPVGSGEVTIKLPTLRAGGPKGPEQVAPDELAGVVVDTRGRPIEGVLAHAYSWVPRLKALTDKNGRFRVKVPEQGKIEIRLTKDGYEPREFLGQPTGQAGWVVVMGDRTYFEGRVLAPDGSPVSNAPIRADSGPKRMGDGGLMTECWTEGRSGKDGRYRLYVEPGMYEFQVRVPGAGVARLPKQAIATDEVRALDIPLAPGVNFEARVVDAQDGKPIAGFVLKDWRNPSVAGTSDSEGIIRIPAMMPGRFAFGMIQAKGYARWWSDACLSEWTRFEKANRFGFQRNLDGLDFDMRPGMAPVTIHAEKAATIRGRVLAPDGKPVAGATVAPALTGSGNSLTGDTRFSVETNRDGSFTMRLPASGEIAYNLVAHDGQFQQWRTWANGILAPFRTTPGQVIDGVILSLTRPATVRGRVVDAAGQPVVGREVRASAADKRENRYYDPTTKTGPDGAFELRFIRAGRQHIQVSPFWLDAEQAPAGTSRTLTLAEGETQVGVALTASPDR